MEEYGLSRKQLFTLTRKTLEKRVNNYYQATNDGNGAIEILIALQVRGELCDADFSMMLMELVQHIFLRTRSTAAMRRYYLYFAEYFEKKNGGYYLLNYFPRKRISLKSSGLYILNLLKNLW